MENEKFYCSSKDHENVQAISFCQKCEIYMCNKCELIHSKLCKNHQIYKLNRKFEDIFTGFCKEKNHNDELEFYCKSHNKLCCVSCLCKIKEKGKGQHFDCDVVILESIKEEKRNKLINNIKQLEDFSSSLKDSINKLNDIFKNLNENREQLKIEIQNTFTKLRNELNIREDEILKEVDSLFDKTFFDENLIKETEKLTNKLNISLEDGKKLDKKWDEEKLNLLINECINFENKIIVIEKIKEKIKESDKYNYVKIKFKNDIEYLTENIKKFGNLEINNDLIYLKDSLIINNNFDYMKTLFTWINIKKNIEAELLYRKSRDGDSYEVFHQLCDNKGKTLCLFKITENCIIGAFTPIDWDNSREGWKKDDETFIFSLTNNKIYRKSEKSTESIYCGKNIGPWFGGIGTRDKNMTQGEFQFSRKGWEFYGNIDDIIPNEGKSKFFEFEEVEIFKLIIN